jgi:uncharacterized protein YjbJ (UPF0337 family)
LNGHPRACLGAIAAAVFDDRFWEQNTQARRSCIGRKEATMDWNRVEGNWKQMKGAVKQQWGKLTDDDLTQINGSQEKLEGIIQERYGIARDETRKQIDSWYQNRSWQ